ncbi:MAG: MBL fold metallo-hydrolase [Kordiimonadaceae bacterium]|nr:MBL fold metallo-hydrolase [Kordiimonadaceae bacterium]
MLNTHHHWDHTGANLALKKRYAATVVGPPSTRPASPALISL